LILFVVRPVAPEFRVVEILGWIDHDEAWEKGEPSGYDSEGTHVISEEYLNSPMVYAEVYTDEGEERVPV
jgi:hypothetical protein